MAKIKWKSIAILEERLKAAPSNVPRPASSSSTSKNSPSSIWRRIDSLPEQIEVWHEGRCGACGRALTVPESIRDGIGPDCAKRVGRLANVPALTPQRLPALTPEEIDRQEDEREHRKSFYHQSHLESLRARFRAATPAHQAAMLEDDDGTLREALDVEREMQAMESKINAKRVAEENGKGMKVGQTIQMSLDKVEGVAVGLYEVSVKRPNGILKYRLAVQQDGPALLARTS